MDTLTQLINRVEEKHENYNKVVYVKKLPPIHTIKEFTFIGKYSYTKKQSNERILTHEDEITLKPGLTETPPFVARTYLGMKYKSGPRVSNLQAAAIMDGLRPVPNYARPVRFDHGFYIDIKSAWWEIINIVGWDVDYFPGKWLSDGTHPDDFPFPDNKVARSCLVTAGNMGGIPYIQPSSFQIKTLATGNSLANISIQRVISDVLNSIAYQAIKAGAVYVANDGFIAPDENKAGRIIQIIKNWGLEARIKGEGTGGVKSSGAYKTGAYFSEPWKQRAGDVDGLSNVFKPAYIGWLEREFSFWARERKSI